MKHNSRFNLFGLFAVATLLLLAAACMRDPMKGLEYDGDDAVVRFTIQPEGFSAATRADANGGRPEGKVDYPQESQFPHISDGTKARLLVYAVYDENGTLLPEFGQRERDIKEGENTDDNKYRLYIDGDTTSLGIGQTLVKTDKFPVEVVLPLKRNVTYKVAFWAQAPDCKFYDIHDLKAVKVHYAEIESASQENQGDELVFSSTTPNNDESRDAFCRVKELKLEKKQDENQTVLLYRPLAQINVGTTGYDYETAVQMKEYTYSRIQIVAAARYLDVVNDKVLVNETSTGTSSAEYYSALEFGWARIPAYINYDDEEFKGVDLKSVGDKEEFLKVHLYKDNEINDDEYMPREGDFCAYAGLADNNKKTETFKYLSMCYVLVPSNEAVPSNTEPNDPKKYASTTLGRVRVWLATDAQGADAKEIVNLSNVHATRNWRTNIVGDIMTTNVGLQVVLEPTYAGDYNGMYKDGDITEWSGWLDEGHGAYYDAENDEILISNVNGLLWLQQMVNGDLVYTVQNPAITEKMIGKPIRYFTYDGKNTAFGADGEPSAKGIMDPTIDPKYEDKPEEARQLKARILRATHQDKNKAYNEKGTNDGDENKNGDNRSWPKYNNFHFVGEDGPAKVKLMADIDLSGIEWLGIGFDCKMDQTGDMLADNNSEKLNDETKNGNDKNIDKTTHRAFFGTFDGNGHTVSNLKTKRFSTDVHAYSVQGGGSGPYEAVQWYARGFFGQLGGNATVKNLTLRNVDIYGNHCLGGIAGAAIGVNAKEPGGTNICIKKCTVDGGRIENVPMYRGDIEGQNGRTYARGVNTGGIVGMYNAGGSVTECHVRNLIIDGYRTVGGIVGCIVHKYFAYWTTDGFKSKTSSKDDTKVNPASITDNHISNSTVMGDNFKPFAYLRHGEVSETETVNGQEYTYKTAWGIGYSWGVAYNTYCMLFVGGEEGYDKVNNKYKEDYYTAGNTAENVQRVDFSGYYKLENTTSTTKQILARTTDIENVTIEELPMLSNWFVDEVSIKSNLIGTPSAYKRYKTHTTVFSTKDPNKKELQVPFDLPRILDVDWDTSSGRVGMHVGAIVLDGADEQNLGRHIFSVREATGKNDCAIQITSLDRSQFSEGSTSGWITKAQATVSNLSVRGNPYAYTGICLSPNKSMSEGGSITLSNVAVYDVYQTLALDLENSGNSEANVWPKSVSPVGVILLVKDSNLRGYTVPGVGWKTVTYNSVVFERGAHILAANDPANATEYTCQVDETADGTTFTDCTFKAPYIIGISKDVNVSFEGTTTFAGDCTIQYGETKVTVPSGAYTKVVVKTDGSVILTDMSGQETTVKAAAE